MSDSMRKGLGEQVGEKVTPQSQKSTGTVLSENVSGAADKAAGAFQPSEEKSTTQKIGDSTRSNADSAQNESSGYLDSAKNTLGSAAETTSNTLSNAADSVTGKTKEATE